MSLSTTASETSAAQKTNVERLRVLHYIFFPKGGIARYTHELLEYLHRDPELEMELACPAEFDWAKHANYHVWSDFRSIEHPQPWIRRMRFLRAQWANPRLACGRAIETNADIIHFQNINHFSYPLWRGAMQRTGAKLVITVHDVRRQKAILIRQYEDAQLRRMYREADALFVHAENQRQELGEFAGIPPEKVTIVSHGVYGYGPPSTDRAELRRKLGVPEGAQVALFFGHVRDDKNLDLLLRVLPRHTPNLYILIAGPHGAKGQKPLEFYQQLSRDLDVADYVNFVGSYVPDDEVADLFGVCDWVALPYSRRFTSQSGVLNVAAEYHRPVLVTAAPTLGETIRACDIGVLVEPDDLEALNAGVHEIRARIEQGHRHHFEEYARIFGWEESARRTKEVYRRLTG